MSSRTTFFLCASVLVTLLTLYRTSAPTTAAVGNLFQWFAPSSHSRGPIESRRFFPDTLNGEDIKMMPKHMIGEQHERVHYMETIKPVSDEKWFSACIVDDGAEIAKSKEAAESFDGSMKHRRRHHGRAHGSRHHRRENESIRSPRHEVDSAAIPTEAQRLPSLTRDSNGRHRYESESESSPRVQQFKSHPAFGLKHRPRRNPALACRYSAQYRAQHPKRCDPYPSLINDRSSVPEFERMTAPFKEVKFTLQAGRNQDCAAFGWFNNDIMTSGWNYLYLESNPNYSDDVQARGAGFLEGALTTQQIYEHRTNEFDVLFTNSTIDKLTEGFIDDMTTFNLQMAAKYDSTHPYWHQVGLLYQQIQGIAEGYAATQTDPTKIVTYFDLILLQYDGDMTDIQHAVGSVDRISVDSPLQQIMDFIIENGRCSALVKLTEGHQELWAAHDTWAGFASTHRMFKAYRLPFTGVASSTIHFSSYPGFVDSSDDWYQALESQLTVLETTNDVINQTLYNFVDSQTVGTWARSVLSTRLSNNGQEWVNYFGYYQSGTYNNQWMVIDYKLYRSGESIQPNTMWIIEVMPGSAYSMDVSSILDEHGYWASYNRPYFTPVYDAMGYAQLNETYGPYLFGYSHYFRGEMFARDQGKIESLYDMQRLMSLNQWQTDPLSRNNSGFAISSRFDLSTYDPIPSIGFFYRGAWGAYDVKITNSLWNTGLNGILDGNALRVSTHSGPTHFNNDQPVFTWNDPEWANYSSHIGLPQTYDFDFVQFHL